MTTSNEAKSPEPKRLYRSKVDRIIAGVCGGFAEYFAIDPVIVRLLFIVLIFVNGWGFLLYFISLIVMKENPHQSATDRKQPANTSLYWGAGLIVLGLVLLANQWDWRFFPVIPFHWDWFRFWFFDWDVIWPLIIILLGILYLVHVLRQGEEKAEQTQEETKLYRSRDDKIIAGVCGGLAKKLNVDPVLVRIGWVIFTFATSFFVGAVIYIVWLIAVPEQPLEPLPVEKKSTPKKSSRTRRVKKMPKEQEDKSQPESEDKK